MSDRLRHTYTQVLVIGVLAFEMRETSWWLFIGTLMVCVAIAIAIELATAKMNGE
jgi:hypothetical protein